MTFRRLLSLLLAATLAMAAALPALADGDLPEEPVPVYEADEAQPAAEEGPGEGYSVEVDFSELEGLAPDEIVWEGIDPVEDFVPELEDVTFGGDEDIDEDEVIDEGEIIDDGEIIDEGEVIVAPAEAAGEVLAAVEPSGAMALTEEPSDNEVLKAGVPESPAAPEPAVVEGEAQTDEKVLLAAGISEAPTYGGVFEVYDTYFNFYPYDMAMQNQRYDLYMEYSGDGGATWARTGYMRANFIKLFPQQGYKIDGLAPNTDYLTRIMYGSTIGGQFVTGPALATQNVKTGAAGAPAIKKVTLKAIRVKKHRVRHAGYYNLVGGMLFWHKAYTEKYYTCKLKLVVKLKHKPNTNGMYVSVGGQGVFLPGNKKKYTATFTPTVNYFAKKPKKGRYRYDVVVRSAQSDTWGGYSAPWSSSKKVK